MKRHIFLCNGSPKYPARKRKGDSQPIILDYRTDLRVRLALPDFVRSVLHIPSRLLDLLEIAAYVFAADRLVDRGDTDAVEYSAWSRDMCFAIRVRDADFWQGQKSRTLLSDLLLFVSGDRNYEFAFSPGHETPAEGLFDREDFVYEPGKPHHVMLFSGGLDSLTGAVERLASSNDRVCLVSHRSSLPSTARTQDQLVEALRRLHPARVLHYRCSSHLVANRAVSEAQRTRTFLYGSIAFALARALNQEEIFFYENGVTSLNLQRRQDLLNARASRTTHPRTLLLLERLFSHVNERPFSVRNPYCCDTKADVLTRLAKAGGATLLSSSVSCSRTFRAQGNYTHCGHCFQCIDRRFATYASGLAHCDNDQLYAFDLATQRIDDADTRTAIIDYVRSGLKFSKAGLDQFFLQHGSEVAAALADQPSGADCIEPLWMLMKRFGEQTINALKALQREKDDLDRRLVSNSLLQLIAEREYLREDAERLARRVVQRMRRAIPKMFAKRAPHDEGDFNDKVHGILDDNRDDYKREFPSTVFALARVVPDHELANSGLIIEAKYLRGATTPSRVSDAIAADLIKYPANAFLLFLVYDPGRSITDDRRFTDDVERARARSLVALIR